MRGFRMLLSFLIVVSILSGGYAYTGNQAFELLPPGPPRAIAWSLLILAFVALPLTLLSRLFYERLPGFETLSWIAYVVFGFVTLLFSFFLIRDIIFGILTLLERLLPDLVHLRPYSEHTVDGAILATAVIVATYGFFAARRIPRVRRVVVPIAGLHPHLDGIRIVQLSDIHIGPTIRRPFVEAIVARANALEGDLIAITGDLVDGSVDELHSHAKPLSSLRGKHGVFFVLGNHDYYSGAASWAKEITRLGLRVLINEHTVLSLGAARMILGGVTDLQAAAHIPSHASDPHAAMKGSPAADLRVLLAHQPRSAFEAAEAGFDLVLCGHTHGGQYFPGNLIVRMVQPFSSGLHRYRKMWVYTSRGTGYWGPPLRIGAPAEITEITLKRLP